VSTTPLSAALTHLRGLDPGADAATAFARLDRLERDRGDALDWFEAAALLMPSSPAFALAVLDRGLQKYPADIAMRYLRGNALRLTGQPVAAEAALREVIERMPTHLDASISLAYLLRAQGRMVAFAEVVIRSWRHAPRSTDGDLRALTFLVESGRIADAALLLPAILGSPNEGAPVHALAGEILTALGAGDQARAQFSAALAAKADLPATWCQLADAQHFGARDDADFVSLLSASQRSDLLPSTRTAVSFALAKAYDDLGDIEAAARLLTPANADWRRHHHWDAAAWQRFVDERQRVRLPSAAASDAPVVFIVGLPCSGSTRVARHLAGDARVRNRGTTTWLDGIASRLASVPSVSAIEDAARLYLAHARQDDAPATLYLDATPMNFRHLDLIAAMLPNARVIHCRRDPRDTAVALWRRHFTRGGMDWSYDLGDIATMFEGHAQLLRDWRGRLSVSILDVDYEALVGDPVATLARVREFLGLAPAAPHPPPPEPLHARSIGRWQRYAPHLPELAVFERASDAGGRAH